MSETRFVVSTPDGAMDGYLLHPDGDGAWPAAILYMDAMGIRPDLLGMARRLSAHGYVVAVPNLYYRSGPQPPVDTGAFAAPGPERERVFALMRSIDQRKVMVDTGALLEYLTGVAAVRPTGIGTVGYCMGGGYALSAAGTFPDRIAAAASFHGGWLATDSPDSPHRLAGVMRARLYIGVADDDPLCPAEECDRLARALQEAGRDFALEVYAGARHGFSVAGHPMYDRDASERHWERLLLLFDRALGSAPIDPSPAGPS